MNAGRGEPDPYVYPGSNVLRNLADIRDSASLERFERRATSLRMDQLAADPLPGSASVEHVRAIHRHVFQDVYSWAGELRTVNIARYETHFAPVRTPVHDLESWGKEIFSRLRGERYLQGLTRGDFVARMGHYATEINYWHPFREGNGRTTRVVLAQLATGAGYALDYTQTTPAAWNQAAAQSNSDERAFSQVLGAIISVPRAIAFDRESREVALRKYPELRGAYDTLKAIGRAASKAATSAEERSHFEAKGRAELSRELHQGRVIDSPRALQLGRSGPDLSR